MDREVLESWLAEGKSLDQMGRLADRHPSTVSYWLAKYGLRAPGRARHGPIGPPDRAHLEEAVAAGLTIRQIASNLGRSPTSIRYWIRRWDLPRPIDVRRGTDEALGPEVRRCPTHGVMKYVHRPDGHRRCPKCEVVRVADARRRRKKLLVDEAGGRCVVCGYDRSAAVLQFHHVNPDEKSFALCVGGRTRALDVLRREAAKCVLLCPTCHAEVEAGIASLPLAGAVRRTTDPG